jgi:hypothetical protein
MVTGLFGAARDFKKAAGGLCRQARAAGRRRPCSGLAANRESSASDGGRFARALSSTRESFRLGREGEDVDSGKNSLPALTRDARRSNLKPLFLNFPAQGT